MPHMVLLFTQYNFTTQINCTFNQDRKHATLARTHELGMVISHKQNKD